MFSCGSFRKFHVNEICIFSRNCHLNAVFHFCSGCIGLFCPCFLFGKNAEFLGSGTLVGSCMTHLIMYALFYTVCCPLTEGFLLGLPGCFVSCYACGYRRALRSKYNLPVRHRSLSRYLIRKNCNDISCVIFILIYAGSTMWGLCYSFLLSSVCNLSRVQGDPRKIRRFKCFKSRFDSCSCSAANPNNGIDSRE